MRHVRHHELSTTGKKGRLDRPETTGSGPCCRRWKEWVNSGESQSIGEDQCALCNWKVLSDTLCSLGVIGDNDDDEDIHVRYELTPNNFNCSFKRFCKMIL